jgi:hypothetical protein
MIFSNACASNNGPLTGRLSYCNISLLTTAGQSIILGSEISIGSYCKVSLLLTFWDSQDKGVCGRKSPGRLYLFMRRS